MTENNLDVIEIVQKAIREKTLLISKEEWLNVEQFMQQALVQQVITEIENIPGKLSYEEEIEILKQVLPVEVKQI